MPKPLSADCQKKLKAIEEDLLNIVRQSAAGHINPIEFRLKEAAERIDAKRSSTVGDEDCKKKLKEIEDELLLLAGKPMAKRNVESLVKRITSSRLQDPTPGESYD